MKTSEGITASVNTTRPVLIILTLMVTIVVLFLVINGIHDQRTLVAQQTISKRLYLEDQIADADIAINKRAAIVMAKLRNEVTTHLEESLKTRACAAAFGCPEFASNLITEASVFNRKGRRSGAEYSSLGDRILTLGDPNQYEKIITALSNRTPFQWGITKPTDNLRPYCWLLANTEKVICIAVQMQALAKHTFEPVASSLNAAGRINFDLLMSSAQSTNPYSSIRNGEIILIRNLAIPFEHFSLSAAAEESSATLPYWLYSALFALALGASVTGFAAATYRAHRASVNEAISKITTMASISHSLRTPLTNLRLYADLLVRHNIDPQAVRKFAMIVDSEASRLTTVIDNVLEIGRADEQQNTRRENPDTLLLELLSTFGAGNIPDNIEVKLEVNREILFDCGGFQQILVNLIDNAQKYAPDQQVSISTWQKNSMLFLQVRDFGKHNTAAHTKDLTTAYRRGSSELGGFGLGLAACKIIAERNSGALTVEHKKIGYCITASLKIHHSLEHE